MKKKGRRKNIEGKMRENAKKFSLDKGEKNLGKMYFPII